MNRAEIEAVFRREWPGSPVEGGKRGRNVKFLLTRRVGSCILRPSFSTVPPSGGETIPAWAPLEELESGAQKNAEKSFTFETKNLLL